MAKVIPWTLAEDQIVREHYHTMTAYQLMNKLPGRTVHAIRMRAYSLGISRRKQLGGVHKWRTKEGLQKLRQLYAQHRSVAKIAPIIGISPVTLYNWQRSYPEIREALEQARSEPEQKPHLRTKAKHVRHVRNASCAGCPYLRWVARERQMCLMPACMREE